MNRERQLTFGPGGRILTNANVWSADGHWIVFDTRSDPAGALFDGSRIQAVHVETCEVRTLYESRNGAYCGVASFHPTENKVAFILGPENPTAEWSYAPSRRQGIIVDFEGSVRNLDACDLVPPFTPGAHRGGSHVHIWHPKGDWISFTYEDEFERDGLRNVAVAFPNTPVVVPKTHPRNHDGNYFCRFVTRCLAEPKIASDEISRACEEAWLGNTRNLAFQGTVHTANGPVVEVFLAELLLGGYIQHRLTRTTERKYPGIQGPRHWLRSSPDGTKIGCLMKDDSGIVQFWTVDRSDGEPRQITHSPHPMASAFTWHPDGRRVAIIVDGSVSTIDTDIGVVTCLTQKSDDSPRPEACVFSPDGSRTVFVRNFAGSNQICVVDAE